MQDLLHAGMVNTHSHVTQVSPITAPLDWGEIRVFSTSLVIDLVRFTLVIRSSVERNPSINVQ